MHSFRTEPPEYYLTPSREEMREMAERVGLKKFSPALLGDLANLAAGGTLNPPSVWRNKVAQWVMENLPVGKRVADAIESSVRFHASCCDFLRSLDLSMVPGATPLEKGVVLLKLLSGQPGGQPNRDGEAPPIFFLIPKTRLRTMLGLGPKNCSAKRELQRIYSMTMESGRLFA